MKLYLADEEKLNIFDLPEKISESFLFSYIPNSTNIEVFFNIYSKDNNWYLKNTEDIKVNDSNLDVKLEKYCCYAIKIKGIVDRLFYLYTYESYNNNYIDLNIKDSNNITIGCSENDTIINPNGITSPHQITILEDNGVLYIEHNNESKSNSYVNNRILTKQILKLGDTIFIDNLRIIYMHTFIRVFIPNNSISYKLNAIEFIEVNNNQYLNYNPGENDIPLYKDSEFFSPKNRLTMTYDEEEVIIDPPTQKESKEDLPAILSYGTGMTIAVSAVFTAYRNIIGFQKGTVTKTELSISIITASVMLFCSFLVPKLSKIYNKRRAKKRDKYREEKYTKYLTQKNNEINKILKYESDSLYDNNPSSLECYENITGVKNRLFERQITHSDFLTLRVGLGNIESSVKVKAPEEKFTLDEDPLIKASKNILENSKTLVNVPITISLVENFLASIICNLEESEDYLNGIMLQLLCLHNPKDLKIVFLTSKKNSLKWDYLKLVPHIYSDDKSMRYYAENEEEAKKILNEIEYLYNERKSEIKNSNNELNEELDKKDYYKSFSPYYIIITDNYKKYKNIEFLKKFLSFTKNIGFSLLIFDDVVKNLPNECNKYTYVTNKDSCIFESEYVKSTQTNFKTELFKDLDMYRVARELSNVPIQKLNEIYSFPSIVTFLEMYNVGNIEQLNILNKWNTSNPITTLSCPIGVTKSGELFKLDLHEKAHGPHGLIAGSTGSGKSEFIISFVLSMAVNYHPHEVQFVLIDYKGGGLAGAFENKESGIRIPHLAGTITNLDVSEMNRTLVSINSELKRRQKKFNEVRDKLGESTIDIYKYQKYYREGLIDEPIAHLFIISDEFAELKQQQPEFMDELISTARIGRSLGVHLILATQKPSGVVNDQIWSNSRFKVCLKVQTKSDSMEMLKRPEAASIKETGRFYLQVGYDELFEIGQSAWTGAQYIPTEKVVKKVDDSISFINNTGDIIKSINNINNPALVNKNNGDQLTSIVKYLNTISINNKITKKQLWLESIPSKIYLSNTIKKYNYVAKPFIIEAVIGEYDDPSNQKQNILKFDLTNTGNVLVYGIPGSGKENLLTTIITSICINHSTNEVNLYILDFGAETLSKFKDFPQVGDVVFINDIERITALYNLLVKEVNKRKTLFADYLGSYTNYIKTSGKTLPNIVCIIHQFETMNEMLNPLIDKFSSLFKDGPNLGISFIVTNSLSTGIRLKYLQLFPNKLALKLAEHYDYRITVEAPRGLIPANHFGRGIVKLDRALEFQTAYVSNPNEITNSIIEICKKIKNTKMKNAPKIPSMPDFFTVDKLINIKYDLSSIPVGISKNKLSTCTFDFSVNYVPVLSSNLSDNIHFIYGLIELLKQIPNTKIRIIDVLGLYENYQGIKVYNNDFDTIIKQIRIETLDDKKNDYENIFIIIGLGAFKNNVPEKTQRTFNFVYDKINEYKKNRFIIYDDYNSYKSLETESWYIKNIDKTSGIWLGENAANQLSIKMPNLTLEERKTTFNQIGFIVKNSSHTIIRYVVDKEFDNEK